MDRRNLRVVAVTFETESAASAYVRDTGLDWPLLVDQERSLYRAYGMGQGRRRDILGLASWKAYAKLMVRGRRIHRPTGDTRQLGGDVLIDPQGVVRLHHVGSGPADRPSVAQLLAVVDALPN